MKMNKESITAKIQRNLTEMGIDKDADIRVRFNLYDLQWDINVITDGFLKVDTQEERKKCLEGLNPDDVVLNWVDLMTKAESEWAGALLGDDPNEELPLWPEILSYNPVQGSNLPPRSIESASLVTTFYSFDGGAGQSTALAYTAHLLANDGLKVICLDFDLTSPSLPSIFGCEDKVVEGQGIVDLLIGIDQGADVDIKSCLIPINSRTSQDKLYVLPAGKFSADYARRLRFINFECWYSEDRNPLKLLLDGIKKLTPDVILIDASSGMSPSSAPLLFDLADMAMIVFSPEKKSEQGNGLVVKGFVNRVMNRPSFRHDRSVALRFIVSPMPEGGWPFHRRSLNWINSWLGELNNHRAEWLKSGLPAIKAEKITHFISYNELIATSDSVVEQARVWDWFGNIAAWILEAHRERELIRMHAKLKVKGNQPEQCDSC